MNAFRKTGVSTVINIIGMSIAFAAAMILMVQVRWDTTYDANFKGHGKVFRMENNWMDNGLFSTFFSRPLIEAARAASPNIEAVGTMDIIGGQMYFKEGDMESSITLSHIMVDSSMFSVFPFEWVEGSAKDFTARGTAVINDAVAEMLFGTESAVGKVLQTSDGATVRISGVFREPRRNSSMYYDIIENIGDICLKDREEWSFSAFVKLKNPEQAEETEAMLEKVCIEYFGSDVSEEEFDEISKGFRLTKLHDAHFERDVRANVTSANKTITLTLAAIAVILILIAIINFINFAFAEIPFRIKNINTRKVLGEDRASLIRRQLLHAGLISLIAFGTGCLIMHLVAGSSLAANVSDSLELKDNLGVLAIMLGAALLSSVIAGIAPAAYSTSQPAALVLKGSYAMSAKGKALRSILVGLQFVMSFIFILMALFIGVQTRFMMSKDMGFPQENILQIHCGTRAGSQCEALESHLLQNPSIEAVTFSDNMLVSDQKMGWGRTDENGKQIFMEVLPVDVDFVRFFGLDILEGRDFQESDNLSENGCFIVNESFIQHYPTFHVGSLMGGHIDNSEIIGKVKDFNFKSLQHAMGPFVLYNWGKTKWRPFSTMYVRTVPGSDFNEVSKYIREAVVTFDKTREPAQVNVRHLDEWIESMYQSEQSLGKLITTASLVALLIAIIGIIGLVFFETQFIRKEIAVRRVNGATVGSILKMINRKYLILASISFAIAAPISYWLIVNWRKGFAYQASVPLWIFMAALIIVAVIALAVVTLQSWRSANANPVESLKNE